MKYWYSRLLPPSLCNLHMCANLLKCDAIQQQYSSAGTHSSALQGKARSDCLAYPFCCAQLSLIILLREGGKEALVSVRPWWWQDRRVRRTETNPQGERAPPPPPLPQMAFKSGNPDSNGSSTREDMR